MEFKDFIQQISNPQFWQNANVFCFQSLTSTATYPGTFFYKMFKHLEQTKLLPANREKISFDSFNPKQIIPLLSQSILGNYSFYWLSNIQQLLPSKNNKTSLNFILNYQGPHFIAFFTNNDTKITTQNKKLIRIKIKHSIDFAEFERIMKVFKQELAGKKLVIAKKIFSQQDTISLDFACILSDYFQLLGTKLTGSFPAFLQNILQPQQKLSNLSEKFFAKDAIGFFKIWNEIEKDYPDMFWLTYWSNQLWKAYHVIKFLHKSNFLEAKKISIGLPFSFTKKHWRTFTLRQISDLHEQLYTIDFAIKTGSTFCALDMFYLKHFSNTT